MYFIFSFWNSRFISWLSSSPHHSRLLSRPYREHNLVFFIAYMLPLTHFQLTHLVFVLQYDTHFCIYRISGIVVKRTNNFKNLIGIYTNVQALSNRDTSTKQHLHRIICVFKYELFFYNFI